MNTTLTVQPYNWVSVPSNDPEINDSIYCWCLDRNSKSHLLRINDFYSFCNVELPIYNSANKPINWNESNLNKILDRLNYIMGDYSPQYSLLKYNEKAYFFKAMKKYPMLQLYFRNFEALKKLNNYLKNPRDFGEGLGLIKLQVWESDISNVRKLLSIRNIKYCQWFTVVGKLAEDRVSILEHEYIVDKNTMNPIPLNESSDWVTSPSLLSIDIETYSDNHKALPKPYNPKHVVNIISLLYTKLNSGVVNNYVITDGECNNIPDCTIIRVKDESDLLDEVQKLIFKLDPDILIGYNILLYDYAYLDTRISRNIKDWGVIGRLYNVPAKMKVKRWESSAYGIQNLNILQVPGRISIDMYPIIQRDYKLNKYTLDFVSYNFLGLNKHDVKAREMFIAYEMIKNSMSKFDSFMRGVFKLDDNFDFTEKRDIFYNKCLEIFKINKLEDYIKILECLKSELDSSREKFTKIIAYCIQDSYLVIKLIETLNTWIGLIEMSNVVGVEIMELFTGGQQQRCISQLYDLCYKRGIVLDYAEHDLDLVYEGGLVQKQIPKFTKNVCCGDYASLYPSIQITHNICASTFIKPEYEHLIPDEMCSTFEFTQIEKIKSNDEESDDEEIVESFVEILDNSEKKDEYKSNENINNKIIKKPVHLWEKDNNDGTMTRAYKFKYIKQEYFKGLIPELVQDLVNERNYTRKVLMKPLEKRLEVINIELKNLDLDNYNQYMSKCTDSEIISKITLYLKLLKENDKKTQKQIRQLKGDLLDIKKYFSETVLQKYNEIEKEIKSINTKLIVLNCMQLAKKVSANSFYGLLGVKNGAKFSLIEAAMTVTAIGRESIKSSINFIFDYVKGCGAELSYGDTDSLMINFPTLSGKESYQLFDKAINALNLTMKGVMKMEFEKMMHMIGIKPKHYAYALSDEDGNVKLDSIDDINKKGLYTAQRGKPKWSANTYDLLLFHTLKECNIMQGFKIILDSIRRLYNNEVNYTELIITKGIGDNYKLDSFFLKVFSDELKAIGKPVAPNSRVDYIVCESTENILGKKMKLLEDFEEKITEGNPYKPDKKYYLENVLMKPLDTLFNVCFTEDLNKIDKLGYKPKSRKHFVSIRTPIKMISLMIEDGISLDGLEQWLESNYTNIINCTKLTNKSPKLILKINNK